ncbi:MAG: DedA family protein [Bacteroidales bacterium]|nr:DedA family protein [Bacteroidales bacterium]
MEFFQTLFDWYMANMNYFTIALLMAIESTFIPLPSEVVIPFAAYKAAQGDLSFWLVILSGTIGALLGSLFNYFLAKYLGRPLVYKFADTRFAHLLMVTKEKVEHAENYFIRNGKSSTFIGRLVPGIRHLISIPAGLAKMKLRDFVLYTAVGAGIWNIILAIVGFYAYSIKDQILHYLAYLLLALGTGFIIYLIYNNWRKKEEKTS